MTLEIALYQPDIAGNVGAILRLGACMGVKVNIIEPCGFAFSDRSLKRAGMDYAAQCTLERHAGWSDFLRHAGQRRIALLTTRGAARLDETRFEGDDILLFGSEGAGVPDDVHARADLRVVIPLQPGFRSLNIGMSAGIALAEAIRQTGGFPA